MLGKLIDLDVHIDDRGWLYEIFRSDAPYFKTFGQVYMIKNYKAGTIRAFHCHHRKEDYFSVPYGTAMMILSDGKDFSKYILTESKPQLLVVPPGIYHGWKSYFDNTMLLNIVTEPFHSDDADDHRIPWDSFGEEIWEITT